MTDLTCPECDPREPEILEDPYYSVDTVSVVKKDGMVDAESGHITRSDHTRYSRVIYAECRDCGTVLFDKDVGEALKDD